MASRLENVTDYEPNLSLMILIANQIVCHIDNQMVMNEIRE